jgi:hypothetical protein
MIRCYVWFFCIAGVLSSVTPLIAQIDRGAIEGRVTDPSGAVVQDAIVQVIQVQTNSALTFVTNGVAPFAYANYLGGPGMQIPGCE